jgi:hypothetical protein
VSTCRIWLWKTWPPKVHNFSALSYWRRSRGLKLINLAQRGAAFGPPFCFGLDQMRDPSARELALFAIIFVNRGILCGNLEWMQERSVRNKSGFSVMELHAAHEDMEGLHSSSGRPAPRGREKVCDPPLGRTRSS